MGNYPCQPVAVYLFVITVNFSFMLEFKPGIIKDISSAIMSHLFAAVEIITKRTFFSFGPFLILLMGSQGCSMFFLELVMKQTYRVCYQSCPI